MVKGVATSIITVAVLMGSLVACGGSDSELAELREELEDVKQQLKESEEIEDQTPAPTSETTQPLSTPTVVPTPTQAVQTEDADTELVELQEDRPMTFEGYDHCTDCDSVKYFLVGAEFAGYEGRVTDPDGFLSLEVWVVA